MRKYLSFETLTLELTRKCNLTCAHCLRGDAQDAKLSYEDIDSLLGQTEQIGTLQFTGGEPLLAIDRIRYVLEQVKALDIPVFTMLFVTNGTVLPEYAIPILKEWSEYLKSCNEEWNDDQSDGDQFFELRVSVDRFHAYRDIALRHIEEYREQLAGYATVTQSTLGEVPRRIGRARNLDIDDTFGDEELHPHANRQIAIIDSEHKPLCLSFRDYRLFYDKQIIVCCGMYLTALGALIPSEIGERFDYQTIDDERNRICWAGDDIYEAILLFNQGRLDCFEHKLQELRKEPTQAETEHLRKLALTHIPDALSMLGNGRGSPFIERFPIVLDDDELTKLNDPAQAEQFLARLRREALYRDYMPTTEGDEKK